MWETNHFNCVHTLEGHLSSVLAVCTIEDDKKLASVSSGNLSSTYMHHQRDHIIWIMSVVLNKTFYFGGPANQQAPIESVQIVRYLRKSTSFKYKIKAVVGKKYPVFEKETG